MSQRPPGVSAGRDHSMSVSEDKNGSEGGQVEPKTLSMLVLERQN